MKNQQAPLRDLVCISHLRWDFVWQRPQHLLARLAQYYRVLFVEEPVTDTEAAAPWLEVYEGRGGVTVARLHQPAEVDYWIGHGDPATQAIYERLLLDYLEAEKYVEPAVWLYTPMALPFVHRIEPKLLIYDVMDELSAFKGAPTDLKDRDRLLLQRADIVFTGGASLYRSRAEHNANTYLFPSGVEIDHFAQAVRQTFERPADLAGMDPPILGYFGVIDERMDLLLLAHLAQTHPKWNLAMIGPVIKIDPADLPQAPNLYYLGMKDYADLPAYLAHFDVALVPFAMNEATRYLSPTKTLEYMAAHKPVVSTPIPDIKELYGDYVRIGHTAEEFTAHVESALAESTAQCDARQQREKELLAQHTWDNIARQMQRIIESAWQDVQTTAAQPTANVAHTEMPA